MSQQQSETREAPMPRSSPPQPQPSAPLQLPKTVTTTTTVLPGIANRVPASESGCIRNSKPPARDETSIGISGLTPSVRDACLKAMQLFQEKELFDGFYLFCQGFHSKEQAKAVTDHYCQGSTLALALLYSRLYVAFCCRHLQTVKQVQQTSEQNQEQQQKDGGEFGDPEEKTPEPTMVDLMETNTRLDKAKKENSAGDYDDTPPKDKDEDVELKDYKIEDDNKGKKLEENAKKIHEQNNVTEEDDLDDTTDVGQVYVQKKFEACPTNVELSPPVSASIYRIANDMIAVHALLPKNKDEEELLQQQQHDSSDNTNSDSNKDGKNSSYYSWTDWSVAHICVLAHDFVMQSINDPKLRKAWKGPLQGNSKKGSQQANQERDMFFIFCEKTTEWMAGRVVRVAEAYQDYIVVWSKSVVSELPQEKEELDNTMSMDEDAAADGEERTDPKKATTYAKLNVMQLDWEPAVPETGNISGAANDGDKNDDSKSPSKKEMEREHSNKESGEHDEGAKTDGDKVMRDADASSPSKNNKKKKKCAGKEGDKDAEDSPSKKGSKRKKNDKGTGKEAADEFEDDKNALIEEETRARTVAWNLSVFFGLFQQQMQQQYIPTRRQRLLASTAAIGLIVGLHRLSNPPAAALTESPGADMDDMTRTLLAAANQECAFTRWACLDHLKIARNISYQELTRAILRLAKAVYTFAKTREPQQMTKMEIKVTREDILSQHPGWLQELNCRVGGDPATLLWNLPSLAFDLVDSFSRQLRREKIKVEASFYYDETTLVQAEHHVELLCKFLNRPMELKQDTRVAIVAPRVFRQRDAGAVAGDGSEGGAGKVVIATGMAEQPDKVEKQMDESNKRRKLSHGNENPDFLKAVTPAVISEAMELTEWTVALLYLENVVPTSRLRQFLVAAGSAGDSPKRDWTQIMIPILNATLLKLSQEGLMNKTTRKAAVAVQTLRQAGGQLDAVGTVVMTATGEVTHDKALCRALVAFYYHALESMLEAESKRLGGKMDFPTLVLNKDFHRALLSCCAMCVVKAVGNTQKLRPSPDLLSIQVYQALLVCDSNPYEFLKVSEFFVRSLSSTAASKDRKGHSPFLSLLPRILKRDFLRSETNVLESLVWARDPKFGTSLPDRLEDFEEQAIKTGVSWWPVRALYPTLPEEQLDLPEHIKLSRKYPTPDMPGYKEYKHVCRIVEKVLQRSYQRIQALCQVLDIPSTCPLSKHVWIFLRYIMRWRIDLFYDRHLDHWILSCLYGVAKQMKIVPEVKFVKIVDAYVTVRGPEMGDVTCQRIVRNIKIGGNETGVSAPYANTQWGNVITLYNKIFVPVMKDYLFTSESLQNATERAQKTVQFTQSKSTQMN